MPTAQNLFLLVLSMIAMESADSIRSLYRHFLSKVTQKSLSAFYYVCSYAKIDCSVFMNITARFALGITPESLKHEPVFLYTYDTMIAKYGQKFENVSKLFDHAAHNGFNYLNGHCFVSLMLCVPVWNNRKNLLVTLFIHNTEQKSIETMINLINFSYSAMKILPYKDEAFSKHKNAETKIKSNAVIKALKTALSLVGYHG